MGHYLNTDDYFEIDNLKNFDDELKEYVSKIDTLSRVQFCGTFYKKLEVKLLKSAFEKVYNELILKNKSIELRFYGFEDKPVDLDWIADLSEIECLWIESWGEILNIEKLANFKNLKRLHLDFGMKMKGDLSFLHQVNPDLEVLFVRAAEKRPKVDLMPITQFKNLKSLWVMYFEKNLVNALAELPQLEKLRLRSISSPKDLGFIEHLLELNYLSIELCSFTDISAIAKLKNLTSLNLFRLLKVENVSFLSDLQELRSITLDTLSNIQSLPKLRNLKNDCEIHINSCKKLTDYTALANNTMIKAVNITTAPIIGTEPFMPILQNSQIEYISIYSENAKQNRELKELVEQYHKKSYWDYKR